MIDVSAALIIRKGLFLVTKRAYGNLKGKWEFPGGKIEGGETASGAIVREIKEELGIDIIVKKELAEFTHKYPFNEVHLILILCEMSLPNKSINSDGSHDAFIWVNLSKSLSLDFAPLDMKIIKYIKANKLVN